MIERLLSSREAIVWDLAPFWPPGNDPNVDTIGDVAEFLETSREQVIALLESAEQKIRVEFHRYDGGGEQDAPVDNDGGV